MLPSKFISAILVLVNDVEDTLINANTLRYLLGFMTIIMTNYWIYFTNLKVWTEWIIVLV